VPLWLALAALLAATLTAYQPAWRGGLLWDDDAHITRPELRSGEGLVRIWTEPGATQQYYPLLHSASWALHRLFGDHTLPYHLLNIGLHALNAWLFGLILRRLAVPWAWLAAFLFALHPVHAESVAWITEMKNTLSGMFFLLAALAYLRFDERRRSPAWLTAFALFVFALLSKSVTATLPAVLLVVCWWRRGRIDTRRDVVPLLPFAGAGAAIGAVTVWAERTLIGARGAEFELSVVDRALVAGRAVWFYLGKLAWPADLIFIYPRWTIDATAWWQYVPPLAAAALFVALWTMRRWSRAPLAALLFFVIALGPALGFVNVYPFRFSFVADHFQYLASLGVIAFAAGGLGWLAARLSPMKPWPPLAAALLVVVPLGALTRAQSRHYADAETLYRATIARDPQSWMAHNNLAVLMLQANPSGALDQIDAALRANPAYPEAHNNRGLALQLLERFEEAAAAHEEAIRLEPGFADAHNNRGTALQKLDRLAEAEAEYREALRLRPASLQARVNLANVLLENGGNAEAVEHYRAALAAKPELADVHFTLGVALERLGRPDEARAAYEATLRLQPSAADARSRLGAIAEAAGTLDEAIAQYEGWVRIERDSAEAFMALGNARYRQGDFAGAAPAYERAVALAPDSPDARNNYGAALERLGRIDEAAAQYAEAVRLAPDAASARANLARVSARRR
jgi:tetratricopeptide (TPR) repeat protein